MAVLTDRLWITREQTKSSAYIGQYKERVFLISTCCNNYVAWSRLEGRYFCEHCTVSLVIQPSNGFPTPEWSLDENDKEDLIRNWISTVTDIPEEDLDVKVIQST